MTISTLTSQFHFNKLPYLTSITTTTTSKSYLYTTTKSSFTKSPKPKTPSTKIIKQNNPITLISPNLNPTSKHQENQQLSITSPNGNHHSRFVIVGAVSVALMMLLMGVDDDQKALALGPDGPLMEEFWDNVRRYGLYAITVSTGALYTIFQPILELLKNPISAILILTILGGGFFIVTQIVSAMIGINEFDYQYAY